MYKNIHIYINAQAYIDINAIINTKIYKYIHI